MKTILIKFAGPLQSWGTGSHFETRHTDSHPSKSAVIGIIAASFGYKRDEDAKINKLNEIDFAVRVDQRGTLMKDYHIARKYKEDGRFDRTYVTERYYLQDAVFVIAISHQDESFITEIENALRNPYFQTFMGRRSLPMGADFILGTTELSPVEILKNYDWQASNWYKKKHNLDYVNLDLYADNDLLESKASSFRRDRVISFSQKERKFAPRYESRINVKLVHTFNKLNKETEHDIWLNVGE